MILRNRYMDKNLISPNRHKSSTMERTLLMSENLQKRKRSLVWGAVNLFLALFFLVDLSFKCPIYTSIFNYIEYFAVTIFVLNLLYHLCRYIYYSFKTEVLIVTPNQKQLPVVKESDSYFKIRKEENITPIHPINNSYETSLNCTPLNWSAHSWKTGASPNDSANYSVSSPSWVYYRGSPDHSNSPTILNSTPQKLQYHSTSNIPFISDEKQLQKYLYDFEQYEKALNASNPSEQNSNLLSSFWSHPATQNPNEISPFLRRTQYQLSSQTASVGSVSPGGKPDENRASLNISSLGNEVWRKLQIDPNSLIQWNAYLRMWISQTILDRLVSEINIVNEEFAKYHLNDVRIGSVGLERLRKTAQTIQVVQHIPTLTTLLPFLEASLNQEYLVKRIKELGKGGCMSEFKWNSGGCYNGKDWDESLVNDSELIIHLLATYLDCQLVPLPNQPDAKPFSKEHLIRPTEKVPHNPLTLAIHQVTEKPPHFRLIVGEEVYEVSKGHNNLFYTVLLFLYFVNKKEHGMLGKVNMGRSGVNMLWIIEEN